MRRISGVEIGVLEDSGRWVPKANGKMGVIKVMAKIEVSPLEA